MLLPLVNRSSGGGGITPTPDEKIYLYKNGVWNIGYDNTSRTWSGSSTNGFTLDSDRMISKSLSIISTVAAYDLSNIAYIHMKCKFSGTDTYSGFSVSSSRVLDNNIKYCTVTEQGTVTDYILDVTDVNSAYIILYMYQANSEIYELYLVPKQRKYIIKDGVLQDGFSFSTIPYCNTSTGSYPNFSITPNPNGYLNIRQNMSDISWSVIGTNVLNCSMPVTAGQQLVIECVVGYYNIDNRYGTSGMASRFVGFAQINTKTTNYTLVANSQNQPPKSDNIQIFSFQLGSTSNIFAFPAGNMAAQTTPAWLDWNIYNAWFY